ncbi:hypothetical protein ANDROMEDA_49 [Bacillus phage Andromeda]|uniref:Uncharacterized protein n=3 Tax=Andromedavirus TaxID=1623275 RepID=M1IEM6_9CAUD|nr:hypothetical protein I905_gp49 [Bacillus phage Andromeda]AGE60888.1 hypothetical protein GEMINI_49 [Bacillus phage Gemini]AGE61119.1 hypothetical protein ANDROMEDA_49 [Bacillus phage Andromeda]QMS41919.1 hypothetical protein Bolokhovo_49 [Bacillus phage Bolokhovo]
MILTTITTTIILVLLPFAYYNTEITISDKNAVSHKKKQSLSFEKTYKN